MDQSRSQRAEQLFIEALELEPAARDEFLDRSCGADAALRDDIEALLDASARSDDYFEQLPERLGVARLMSGEPEGDRKTVVGAAGQKFGQYTLTEPVGRGGMGTVWRAARSDGRFEGEVAVKLLSRLAGGAAPERFALEGRYLAKLTHPNIARLLDAGVGPNEQPFLVLEYIKGLPIDQYCDERALSIEARIQLFLSVLDAVAHAHARLIVHRDIKPSNVQVAVDGTVKLLDFGVAKLLSDEAAADNRGLTREMGTALTPEYAAPEQLNGDTITTATDVYSLGLLLWLLVTGSNPRETGTLRSLAELRALARKEPTRLLAAVTSAPSLEELGHLAKRRNTSSSELLKTLRSDLDNIVRKALAVDPDERYPTVADLAQDLRNYLRHEPVTAQALTIRYRAQKFVRRHRGGVVAAALTLLALLSAAAITVWQGMEAQRQRDAAVYQQQRAQATNEFLTFLLEEVGPQGRPLSTDELLDRGVMLLERQYGNEQRFAGAMYHDVAHRYSGLGQVDRALELLARAETIARAQNDVDLLALTLCSFVRYGYRNDPEAAKLQLEEATSLLQARGGPSTDTNVSCARSQANFLALAEQPQAALELLQATLDSHRQSPFASPRTEGVLLNEIGNMHYQMGRIDLAIANSDEVLALIERSGRGNTVGNLIVSLNRGILLQAVGEVTLAVSEIAALIDKVRELEVRGQAPIGFWGTYAGGLVRLARYDEALQLFHDERARNEAAGNRTLVAEATAQIGRTLAFSGRAEEALPYLDEAEDYYSRTPGVSRRGLQIVIGGRVQALLASGRTEEARRVSEHYLNELRLTTGEGHVLGIALRIAAGAALASGDADVARQYATESLDIVAAQARDITMSSDVGLALLLRAKAHLMVGDTTAARSDLEAALPGLTNGLGANHPDTLTARQLLQEGQ